MKRMRIGIIGCGAIGKEIAHFSVKALKDKVELVGVCDSDGNRARELSKLLRNEVPASSLDSLSGKSDLLIEAASAKAAKEVLEKAIERKKDVMLMSAGGLIDELPLVEKARSRGISVYIPSGAICGIDGIKAAMIGGIREISLTTRKPPKGLEGALYLKEKNIDLNTIKEETVIFEGDASSAVRGFPRNVNVASVLSLAGLGPKETIVRIITSPDYAKNVHEIKISGDFGEILTRTENVPSEQNPRTSRLAYLSAIATLKGIVESVRIGT